MTEAATIAKRPVILIEDNDLDFQTIRRGLKKLNVPNPVVHFRGGEEALAYIRDFRPRPDRSGIPVLVILDLNLPDTHGREILTSLKRHPNLRVVPVVVWSVSSDPTDIKLCYLDGANSYIQKSISVEATDELIRVLTSYWLDLVSLPPPEAVSHE